MLLILKQIGEWWNDENWNIEEIQILRREYVQNVIGKRAYQTGFGLIVTCEEKLDLVIGSFCPGEKGIMKKGKSSMVNWKLNFAMEFESYKWRLEWEWSFIC